MASITGSAQVAAATCLVCFGDATKLKTVEPCKHFFCIDCLDKHLTNNPTGGDHFPCPCCMKECLLPPSGVAGLDDWSRVPGETPEDVEPSSGGGVAAATKTTGPTTSKRPCRICECRGNSPTPDAEFCCEQCRNVLLCKSCADQHKLLPVTSHHVVTTLCDLNTGYMGCSRHHMPLDMFCNSCECSGCCLCVLLDHGDHGIVEIGRVIQNEVNDLQDVLSTGTTKIIELDQLRDETGAARDVVLNWRGGMIQQVEEATEKAINRLLEQKEKLKDAIKRGCDVSGMTDMLQKIPEVVESIQKEVEKGQAILTRKKLDSGFLSELKKARKELGAVLESDNLERDLHWKKLRESLPIFKESEQLKDMDLGQIGQFNYDTREIKATRQVHFIYDNEDAIIHSVVASVGLNDFVLAASFDPSPKAKCICHDHHDKSGKPTDRTLIDNGVVDMAATTDGGIAILHLVDLSVEENQNENKAMALTVFTPNEGNQTGELVCNNLEKAVSFSTDIRGQFVVLSNKADDTQEIAVLNKSGSVIDTSETHNRCLRRVACGGKFIFILGTGCVDVYRIEKGKITFVDSVTVHRDADDITATPSDDVFVSVSKSTDHELCVDVVKVFHLGNYLKRHPSLLNMTRKVSGQSRLDIIHTWIIVSRGSCGSLYQLQNAA
ncbi:uncharacterized protein LOC135499060 [Lineus longissimus]|uniref:uncharacterized protein LOC135499060 n=1 Tax=Lineus longissimus TaxID=88925 RepID=UPI00315D9230